MVKRNIKKWLASIGVSYVLISSMCVPAFAAPAPAYSDSTGSVSSSTTTGSDTTQGKTTSYKDLTVTDSTYSSTNTVNVYATKASTVTYSLPQTLIVGSNGTAGYTVGVKGDLASDQGVAVTPPTSFTMKDKNNRLLTANISQTKKSWAYTDVSSTVSSTTGTVTCTSLPAGSYTGSFNFTITVTRS